MTDREKLIQIIGEWANNAVSNKRSGASVYDPNNAIELADALIEAGVVSDIDIQGLVDGTSELYVKDKGLMCLYKIDEVKRLDRRANEFALEARFQRGQAEKAEHRAEVAERALATVCEEVLHARYPVESVTVSVVDAFIQRTLKEAEKELQEEDKQ